MTNRFVFIYIVFFLFLFLKVRAQEGKDTMQAVSEVPMARMGFSELSIGLDKRRAEGLLQDAEGIHAIPYRSNGFGWTARMQSSFIATYLFADRTKKFKAGDLLAGELSLGGLTSGNPRERSGLWLAYRFEFGAGLVYSLNRNHELALAITLLKFSRDKVSPNISGSGILLKYRIHCIQVEAGIEARRERMFGYLMQNAPVQYVGTLRYLWDSRKNAGLRLESLSGIENRLNVANTEVRRVWSLKLFYGIYF